MGHLLYLHALFWVLHRRTPFPNPKPTALSVTKIAGESLCLFQQKILFFTNDVFFCSPFSNRQQRKVKLFYLSGPGTRKNIPHLFLPGGLRYTEPTGVRPPKTDHGKHPREMNSRQTALFFFFSFSSSSSYQADSNPQHFFAPRGQSVSQSVSLQNRPVYAASSTSMCWSSLSTPRVETD